MRRLVLPALFGLAACAAEGPVDLRLVAEFGCLGGTIAGNVAMAATPPGPAGGTLGCRRGGPGMSVASFRAADAAGDGQVRRLDPDNTGRITLARLRVAMAQDFTRADRDGSATLTPGRWPLEG